MTGALSTSDLQGLSAKELMGAGILFNKKYKYAQQSGALERAQALGYTGSNELDFYNYLNSIQDDEISRLKVWEPNNPLIPYLEEALKYKDSNPYYYEQMMGAIRNYKGQTFTPNKLQEFMELLGDDSARINFNNQRVNNLEQAFANLRESLHTEDVTNPINQVGLRKAAGINDDLNGGSSIGSQEPGNIDQPEMNQAVLNDMQSTFNDVGNSLINLIQVGFSIASSVQGLQSGSMNLAKQALEQREDVIGLFSSELARTMTPEMVKSFLTGNDDTPEYQEARQAVVNVFTGIASDTSLPYTVRKRFRNLKSNNNIFYSTLRNQKDLYKIMEDYANNRLGAVQGLGNPFNSQDFAECIRLFGEFYNQYEVEYEKLIKNFDFEKYNVTDTEGYTQGSLAGAANVAGLSFEAFQKQNDELVERMWNKIYKKLEDKHSDFADILIMLIPMFRSMMMSARVPSLNLGASWNGGTKTNVYRHE